MGVTGSTPEWSYLKERHDLDSDSINNLITDNKEKIFSIIIVHLNYYQQGTMV